MIKDDGFFEDLDDLLKTVEPQKNTTKTTTNAVDKKPFQSSEEIDDDIKFFGIQDKDDMFKMDQNSPIKKETQKFERKKDVRSATMANKGNYDDFDDLFGVDFDSKNTQKMGSNRNINKKPDENSRQNPQGKFNTLTNFAGDNEFEDFQQKTFSKTGMAGIQKNDDLDLDLNNGFTRRNSRRAGTYKDNSDDFNKNSQANLYPKPPKIIDPSLSMPPLNPSSLSRKHPFDSQPFGRKRDEDHLMASLDETDEGGNNRFGYGNRNNLPQTAKSSNQYQQGGGLLDPSPSSQFRARTQVEFGETSRSLGGLSKKGTFNYQELEDNIEQNTNDRNIESVSRVAAARRPRSSVQSQQSSANNTQNNIRGGQSNQFDQQQQFSRQMKSSEDPNTNTNINLGFLNESVTNRPTRSQQGGGKNESSYISDKDLFGDSNAGGDDQIENKYSRRGSFPRGGDNLPSKNMQQPMNMQGQVSGFYQQPTQNIIQTGILSDIPDLKSSEMNYPGTKYDRSLQQAQEEAIKLAKQMQQQEEEHKIFREQLQAENETNNKKFRQNYDEQVISLKRNYEELLKFEKERNEQLQEDMKEAIIKDRERQRALFDIEMQTMKIHFEKEKQQITMTFELKSEVLTNQFQKQAEIINLFEQHKSNQDNLVQLSNRIENMTENNQEYIQQMNEQVEERKRNLQILDSKLKMEGEFIEKEKRRLEKIKDELVEREQKGEQYLKDEKETIRGEIQRLTQLQEQQRELDNNKKNELNIEITRKNQEYLIRTEEILKMKEELEKNWRELEMKAALFEQTKKEFETNQKKIDMRQSLQHKEIEERQIELLQREQLLVAREKTLSLKEREINLNSVNSIQVQKELNEKRFLLEKEKKELELREKNYNQSEDFVREFKNTFELENLKIEQKNYVLQQHERDLMKQAQSLKEERNQIELLQNTMQGIKNEYVKNLASPQRIPIQLQFASPNKNIPFSNTGQQSQSTAALTSPQYVSSLRKNIAEQKQFNLQQSQPKQFYSRTSLKKSSTEGNNEIGQFFRDQKQFAQTQSRFDLNKIVREVNQIDQRQQHNIQYIMAEKDRLQGSKLSARFGGSLSIQQELINDETSSHYISEAGSNRHSNSNSNFNQ